MTLPTPHPHSAPATRPLEIRALTQPAEALGLAEYQRAHPGTPRMSKARRVRIGLATLAGIIAVFALFVLFVHLRSDGLFTTLLLMYGGPIVLLACLATVMTLLRTTDDSQALERPFRLSLFAADNGMNYYQSVAEPPLPGMIFNEGSTPVAEDVVRLYRPHAIDVANFTYVARTGKTTQRFRWSYVLIPLPVPLPHIVLDATINNTAFGSNLPDYFDPNQRLSLEGDFDRYFTLYCPAGYERDALYLFTPDIMARFIDTVATLDVEIIDNHLYLYSSIDLSTVNPAAWNWIVSVIDALVDKIHRWARWRDERLPAELAQAAGSVPPPPHPGLPPEPAPTIALVADAPALVAPPIGVAVPGQRLRTRVPKIVWIMLAIFGGMVALQSLTVLGIFLFTVANLGR